MIATNMSSNFGGFRCSPLHNLLFMGINFGTFSCPGMVIGKGQTDCGS